VRRQRSGVAFGVAIMAAAAALTGCSSGDTLDVVEIQTIWEDPAPTAFLTARLVVDGPCIHAIDEGGTRWSLVFYSRMNVTVTADQLSFETAPGERVDLALEEGSLGPVGLGGGTWPVGLENRLQGGMHLSCNDLRYAWLVADIAT